MRTLSRRLRTRRARPNPASERTSESSLREHSAAAHGKRWVARLRLTALAVFLVLLPAAALPKGASYELVFDEAHDRACSSGRGYVIKSEWVNELSAALPSFRELWKNTAPAMFRAASALTGRTAESFAVPVALTLCDTPSQSFGGPSVNMRYALRSFTAQAVPLRYKVDTAFHESLHAFMIEYVPRSSKLLARHMAESTCVLNHLHLLALQKAVLLAVGELGALEQVVALDSSLPSGCYKRAWALVNETNDTYQQYVAELR